MCHPIKSNAGPTLDVHPGYAKGDNKKEADETFYLELFNASSNSLFAKFQGVGAIWNDDN